RLHDRPRARQYLAAALAGRGLLRPPGLRRPVSDLGLVSRRAMALERLPRRLRVPDRTRPSVLSPDRSAQDGHAISVALRARRPAELAHEGRALRWRMRIHAVLAAWVFNSCYNNKETICKI